MTARIFDEILVKGIRQGQIPAREKESRTWFRNAAKKTGRGVKAESVIKGANKARYTNNPTFGEMYLYAYDAKHKATLPYWDKYPLVFPFSTAKGGFLGLNVHYLPLIYRARLMDALYDNLSDQRFDEKTKVKMSYEILNSAAKYKYFKPCIKHYLWKNLKSRPVKIYSSEWDVALFLPLQSWQNGTQAKVWKDSRRIIRG